MPSPDINHNYQLRRELYFKYQLLHELYIKRSSWIRDMSAPYKPRKKFNPNGAAGSGK